MIATGTHSGAINKVEFSSVIGKCQLGALDFHPMFFTSKFAFIYSRDIGWYVDEF